MEEEIFKKSEVNTKKLIEYGFVKEKNKYIYKKDIMNNFMIEVSIENNKVRGKVIDKELNEEYLNYRVSNQIGEFVNNIRNEFINTLIDIRDNCFTINTFIYNQSNRIKNMIKELYNDNPEFLWEDNNSGVFRNKDNKKWYGIIMNINKNKLTDEDKDVEVLNLKISPSKIEELLKKEGYYKAYHMNKKYWVTIVLDETIKDEEIMELVKESYSYTVTTNEWVIPANPKYFDIINFFNNKSEIDWKQVKNINKDDIIYIYVGAPYSCLLYKCQAIEVNIDSPYIDFEKIMRLKLIETYQKDKYPFDLIKEYDLKAIRGARRVPQKLIDKIKKDENNKTEEV